MTRTLSISFLVALLVLPASAQIASAEFPVNKTYKVVSISGFDVQNKGLTLTVLRNAKTGDLQGSGNAGCNNWTATVILREDQIDFANIASTKKSCGKPQMTAEDAFLTSLRSAKRWRMDGDKFIIEGDAARLMLRGGADKPPASKR